MEVIIKIRLEKKINDINKKVIYIKYKFYLLIHYRMADLSYCSPPSFFFPLAFLILLVVSASFCGCSSVGTR